MFVDQEFIFTQGGAAKFCMQKFLTGLAGLVYFLLHFQFSMSPSIEPKVRHECQFGTIYFPHECILGKFELQSNALTGVTA